MKIKLNIPHATDFAFTVIDKVTWPLPMAMPQQGSALLGQQPQIAIVPREVYMFDPLECMTGDDVDMPQWKAELLMSLKKNCVPISDNYAAVPPEGVREFIV